MNELVVQNQYNEYPEIITYDNLNPSVTCPYADTDLQFYMTKDSLMDTDLYRDFLRNSETRFRASKEYKAYKSYLIEYLGIDRCQVFGNISFEDADIELHHNVLGLFDICILISSHVVNTVGIISTFDLIQLLIQEHNANRVGITFLTKTAHQKYTADPEGYIPPEMTFGKWWELLDRYRYGITYDIANKVINYIKKYNNEMPISINIQQQEQILNYAFANEYGMPKEQLGALPNYQEFGYGGGYSEYGW